jgi:myo-inositol-1(or 4)-monophosphatase
MVTEQRELSRMLEVAIVAARLAGQRAMEEIGSITAKVKNNEELVTDADLRCQQIIVERIKESYPDHGFIAEEALKGKIFKQSPRGTESVWWVIDPIDGTNNFAHGVAVFTVSIAAIYRGQPIIGVIFEPGTESMFTAFHQGYSQLNSRHITAGTDSINPFTSVGIDSHFDHPMPDWVFQIIHRSRFRNFGSAALQLAYVAMGGLIATVACKAKLWDIAAGTLLCRLAGAKVTDFEGNNIFPIKVENYTNQEFQIIAANQKTYPEILEIIRS